MRAERALFGLHGLALVLALAAALAWPRPGQPVLLVPIGGGGIASALARASAGDVRLLAIDPLRARVIARIPADRSPIAALAAGILPVAVRYRGCADPSQGRT